MASKYGVEIDTVLFQKYKYDALDQQTATTDQRRASRVSNTPIQVNALEKKWHIYSNKCDIHNLNRLNDKDSELINKKAFFTGYAAIHWAAKKGRLDVVDWLFEQNADMNIRTNGGYTALHIATIHGHVNVIRGLVKTFGADINVRDYSGKKARHYASNDLPYNVYRALQDTTSMMVNMNVLASFQFAIPQQIPPTKSLTPAKSCSAFSRHSSLPMPVTSSKDVELAMKKKKKVKASGTFKGKRKILGPCKESLGRKAKWRKSFSLSDITGMVANTL